MKAEKIPTLLTGWFANQVYGLTLKQAKPKPEAQRMEQEAFDELHELERLATMGKTLESQRPEFDGIDDYGSLDGMDFSEGARLIKLGLAIDKVFELYPIILGASSDHAKDPGPRAWKDADELLEWYDKEVSDGQD